MQFICIQKILNFRQSIGTSVKRKQWQLLLFRKSEIICWKGSKLGKFSVLAMKGLCLFLDKLHINCTKRYERADLKHAYYFEWPCYIFKRLNTDWNWLGLVIVGNMVDNDYGLMDNNCIELTGIWGLKISRWSIFLVHVMPA